jgi:DNA-binding response OmpR family regulator
METRKPTVLIVDDDEMMRAFLEEYLGDRYRTTTCENGQEALEAVRGDDSPSIVVLDLNMPVIDGFRFLDEVRGDHAFDSLPIVVLSGADDSETRVRCLRAGADDFILKPFNPDELSARIDNLLRRFGAS